MDIVAIIGACMFDDHVWRNLQLAFQDKFPGSTFVIERRFYGALDGAAMNDFGCEIARTHGSKKTLLVGHSNGGIVACVTALKMLTKPYAVVSLFSPHGYAGGIIANAAGVYGVRLPVPIISFQGMKDGIVREGTEHPYSARHVQLDCNHETDIIDKPPISRYIAQVVEEELFREA